MKELSIAPVIQPYLSELFLWI